MKEITEDYVSFEVAKLLKEKGFDVVTNTSYVIDNYKRPFVKVGDFLYNRPTEPHLIAAPSLALAMKWLREVHNFNITAFPAWDNDDGTKMSFEKWGESIDGLDGEYCMPISGPVYYNSYEEACEAAIKYCLENLV